MCIVVNKTASKNALKNRSPKTVVNRYKILRKRGNTVVSLVHSNFEWNVGLNKSNASSNSKLNVRKKLSLRVSKGIHVFVHKKDAKLNASWSLYDSKLVVVKCKTEDLIAVGQGSSFPRNDHEVYTQVTLTQKEYNKVINLA